MSYATAAPQAAWADPTAVVGRRVVAWIIDLIAYLAVFAVVFVAFGDSVDTPFSVCGEPGAPSMCFQVGDTVYFAEGSDSTAISLITLVFGVGNVIILQGLTGASIGKQALGIRVVKRRTGEVCGIIGALLRSVMWIIDGIPFCLPLVGLITGLTTKGHRRVGDMVANTLVVDKSQLGTPPLVPGLEAPTPGYGAPTPGYGAPTPGSPTGVDTPATPAAGTDGPTWDAARNAWIQWDPSQQAWMRFDDASQQWVRLE